MDRHSLFLYYMALPPSEMGNFMNYLRCKGVGFTLGSNKFRSDTIFNRSSLKNVDVNY
jgi:hypothetical protein